MPYRSFGADATGREVIKSSAGDWLFKNNEKGFLQASPDRTYWLDGHRNPNNKGILECKTTQMSIDPDDLPKHWFCQVQYLLGVSEFKQGSLAWLCSGREFGYKDIAFVPDFFGWMIEEVERFWVDNIIGNVEPDATTVTDVITKYARHTEGKIIEVSDDHPLGLQSTESGKSRTCQTRSHQRRTRIENQNGLRGCRSHQLRRPNPRNVENVQRQRKIR